MPNKKTTQKYLGKQKREQPKENVGSIVPTDSWINTHGKAVFVNIPESDAILVKTKYGKKISFVTSLDSLRRLVEGEIEGVNLGKFED